MGNIFDAMRDNAFNVVTDTMGSDASWSPSEGGATQTGVVLFSDPSDKESENGVEYTPSQYLIEYKIGIFDSLYEAVRNNNVEVVTINGIEYYVRQVTKIWDGKTYKALLEIKE